MSKKTASLVGVVLPNGFRLQKLLGSGSFGDVYEGVRGHDDLCAVKVEKRQKKDTSQLKIERKAYRLLQDVKGVCCMLDFGTITDHRYLCLDMLGPNLETVLKEQGGHLPESVVASIGIRALETLEGIHQAGIVHRDIKPQNMCLDRQGKPIVYLVDFGLCKRYTKNGVHIPHRTDKSLVGTPRFCSLRTLHGHEISRRDDVEGLFFCLFYFLHGRLPWQGQRATTKSEKHRKIGTAKKETTTACLVRGMTHASVWAELFECVRDLEFTEQPDYAGIKRALSRMV